MTTLEFIITLFCLVDDRIGHLPKHPQARLHPSELVTIGLLFALKGCSFRAFYRWLSRDYSEWFSLPERTRLQRLLATHQDLCHLFLADPTFFTTVDTYGIELLHPWREGRSPRQLGRKGLSNHRWIVGIKLCWLINSRGEVVAWDWNTANVHDQVFLPLVEPFEGQTITLADTGFEHAEGIPENLKLCPKGTWNERMLLETILSMLTGVCRLKHLFHRTAKHVRAHLAYLAAMFNALLQLNRRLHPEAPVEDRLLHIAQYSL
jgi:hypothetical protein